MAMDMELADLIYMLPVLWIFHRNWRTRANELSETMKIVTMLGTYIRKYYGSRYYGKAMNQTRLLTAAYDKVLNEYDLLVMPTTAIKSQPIPAPDASREEIVQRLLKCLQTRLRLIYPPSSNVYSLRYVRRPASGLATCWKAF